MPNELNSHYRLPPSVDIPISIKRQLQVLPEFAVGDNYQTEFSKINLYYYIDRHGAKFLEKPFDHGFIAKAIFDHLEPKEQLELYQYIEDMTND